jgi:two-component system, NtrC family, response regulator HydG
MGDPAEATRILVVDDRSEMAEMIAEDLYQRGYVAIAITSGREAMHRLRTERFDALITDLRMPEVDGLALLRVSLDLDPSRPVIMMTAYCTLDTAVQASGGGAYHYLTKPFRLEVLSRLIEQALGRP